MFKRYIILTSFFPEREKVAFSASLSALEDGFQFIGPYTHVNTLVYKNAFTNIGNAYDTNTGTITNSKHDALTILLDELSTILQTQICRQLPLICIYFIK